MYRVRTPLLPQHTQYVIIVMDMIYVDHGYGTWLSACFNVSFY